MQLTQAFASVELHWSVKERPQEANSGFLWPNEDQLPVLLEDLVMCILAGTATADSLQWDSVKEKGLAMPNNSPYFLSITTAGQC